MSEVTINIDNYLSEDEKREIAESIFRQKCYEVYDNDHERIFGNVAYKVVAKLIDDRMDKSLNELIEDKVKQVIGGLTAYTVFDKGDIRMREKPSVAWLKVEETIKSNQELITQRVRELISDLDNYTVRSVLEDRVCEAFDEIFKEKATN